MKYWAYVTNLDDKSIKRTYRVSLFIHKNVAVYFEVLNKIRDKSITHNIFEKQDNESTMCRFYCITFIEYMLTGKTLLDYTNLISPNHKIKYKYFKDKYGRRTKSRV